VSGLAGWRSSAGADRDPGEASLDVPGEQGYHEPETQDGRFRMKTSRPTVVWIGDPRHREFRSAVGWLQRHTALQMVPSAGAYVRRLPDAAGRTVIIAQSRPGQVTHDEVRQIARKSPLAHLVALLGSWCEGETRTGKPWPGVTRVYWHQWAVRCSTELSCDLRPTSWQLPRTASPIEGLLHAVSAPVAPRKGTLGICSPNASLCESIVAACSTVGYTGVSVDGGGLRDVPPLDAVVWDGQGPNAGNWDQLARIAERCDPAPVAAMLGFPRYADLQLARQHGARSILSCPFLLRDLWALIEQLRRDDRP